MFVWRKKKFFFLIVPFLILSGCSGGKTADRESAFPRVKELPESSWKRLAGKRIYFGHMSVGNNVIEGIVDLAKENPEIRLNIVETSSQSGFNLPIFGHSPIGNNGDPKSKIHAFADFMDSGLGNRAEIAFFKFCYIDILSTTDVAVVFNTYKDTMANMKMKYPGVVFVHVTAPLRVVQTGFLVPIKKIIGRPVGGYGDNIKRNQFNDLLRKEYKGKDPIFDLAGIESTFPDGRRAAFDSEGKTYYALAADYTQDGGHLNDSGRKFVAEQLLIFLANLSI